MKDKVDADGAINGVVYNDEVQVEVRRDAALYGTPQTASQRSTESRKAEATTASAVQHSDETKPNWIAWIWVLPLLTVLPWWFSQLHYALPAPEAAYSPSGRPQPAESNVLRHIGELERIGYRTVGSPEAVLGEDYVIAEVEKLDKMCKSQKGAKLDCDVWVQSGTGYHSFNIMDHDILKLYSGIRNVIMRIQPKPGMGLRAEKDAILLGSHIDSTLPAPGAADDGIGVGVMLELARVMIERNDAINGSVIFVWNGAEETLQDGSHLYSTQHETAKNVRAVINLEAAGTTGGALVFQATSKEMIEAYAHAPHPRGTVVAAEVFSSGIIISDTDFGQFERYLGVTGLDMAIVGHSYFYHTRKDTLDQIEQGSAQHFANNVQAVLEHLLGPDSPLVSAEDWHPPDLVYLALFDRMYVYWSMTAANKVYPAIAAVIVATLFPSARRNGRGILRAVGGAVGGLVGGIVGANLVAGVLVLLDRKSLWFTHEHLPLVLYVPAAFFTHLSIQYVLNGQSPPNSQRQSEQAHYLAQLILPTSTMLLMQFAGLRSAYMFGLIAGVLYLGIIGDAVVKAVTGARREKMSRLAAYALPMGIMVALGVEAVTSTLDIFTPLTGRMGKDAPSEFIIATICAAIGLTFFPFPAPLFQRLSRRYQRRALIVLGLLAGGVVLAMNTPAWTNRVYDDMHPKRLGVHLQYNHTSQDHMLHIGLMDQGPSLHLVSSIHQRFGIPAEQPEHYAVTPQDPEWDFVYPISAFLDTWKFPVLANDAYKGYPNLGVVANVKAEGEDRRVVLDLDFTDLVWPTVAIDAEILKWPFDFEPPKGRKRHHIKMVIPHHGPKVRLELLVKGEEPIRMDWSAVDVRQMVPSTARYNPQRPGSQLLLALDEWATKKWRDSLDITAAGTITGTKWI